MTDKPTYEELEQRVTALEKSEAELKRAIKTLPKEESHYQTLFEAASDSIFIMKDYKFMECNKMTLKMFGCEKNKDILGFYPWDFSPPNQPDGSVSKEKAIAMMDLSLAGRPQRFYWKHIKKDGSLFDAEVSLNRLETEGIYLLQAIVRDITDRNLAEEALQKSEERYRTLIETAREGVWIIDADTRTTFVNRQMADMLGFSVEEIVGTTVSEYLDDENRELFKAKIKKRKEGHGEQYDLKFIRKNGSEMWCVVNASPLFSAEGDVVGSFAMVTDVTDRMQVERDLRESEERYRAFFEEGPDGVVVLDPSNAKLIEFNDQVCRQLGYSREEFALLRISDIEARETDIETKAHIQKVLSEGYDEFETLQYTKQGEVRHVHVTAQVIEIAGRPVYHCIWRDITERKRVEDAYRKSESKLHQTVAELSAIINTLPGMITVTDLDYNILVANHDVIEQFSHSLPEHIIGKKCYEVRKGRDSICSECGVKRALETGETFVRISTPQEEKMMGIATKAYASPIRDDKGVIWGAVEVIMDITDLRQVEEESILLATTIEQASESVIIADRDGMIRYINPAFEQLSGYDQEEIVGRNFHVLKSDKHDDNFYKEMGENISKGNVWAGRITNRMKDGTLRQFETRISPVRDGSGEIINYVSVNRDITQEIELEAKLQRAKKMEALGLLAGGVAHDLNNVLSGIVSYPELLLLDLPEDSKLRKPIETMKESGQRAAAIVQDLLTVARGVATTKEPLNLNNLVEDYLKSPEFEKIGYFHPTVTVKTNLDINLFNMSGSHVHIRKAIMNLVSNAAEAIEGLGNITISTVNRYVDRPLRGYENVTIGEYAVLSVSDDGLGISSVDLERIFEPFYTKKVMGKSGTGLGLAVVWNVVQDHRGYINVVSNENGTTFELYFPIIREKLPVRELDIPIEKFKGDGETILVVDDIESQREIACEMLNTLGYKARSVPSGEEAVEYLKKHTVDLILLDMIMDPRINGLETYERIIKIHPNQKAVIASGFAETDDVKEAQRLGAGPYLKKPLTLEKLGIAVWDALKK